MKKYFCSGDIHSFFDEWQMSLQNKGFDKNDPEHTVIICGDLFDRGPQTIECFEFVKKLAKENRLIYVRGNHEELLEMCIHSIKRRSKLGSHHKSNGTIKTLSHFMNCNEYDILCNIFNFKQFDEVTNELFDFFDTHLVNYFELGDKVFVHGWVPTTSDEEGHTIVHDNWRDGGWSDARWECGFDNWRCNLIPEGKTVVCGHWHTSYGWSKFRGRSEWGSDAEFTPFIDDGIIAVDGCTAYTHMVNVVVFDEGGNLIE